MTQPPQDALDLYAFGVGYCEERGIPYRHIRVRWESAPTESHLVKVWHWDTYLQETIPSEWRWGHSDYSFVEGHRKRYPRGLYLSFDSPGEAEAFGLSGVTPFEGQDTCLVWVNPGHEFEYDDIVSHPPLSKTCVKCSLEINKEEGPHIQLPACIKRHKFSAIHLNKHRYDVQCDDCKKQFVDVAKNLERSQGPASWPDKIPPEWVKSLGRCPGAP